jgi:hypothetical protein
MFYCICQNLLKAPFFWRAFGLQEIRGKFFRALLLSTMEVVDVEDLIVFSLLWVKELEASSKNNIIYLV